VSSAFWQWIMPLRLLNYQVYDAALYAAESCPDRRDILYGLTLACAVAVSLQAKNSFFLPPFLLALSGFVLYLIERQGLSRDLSLTIFGVTTIGALSFLILGRRMLDFFLPVAEAHFLRRFRQVFFVVVAVAMVGLTAYSLNCDRDRLYVFMVGRGQAYEDLLSVYNKNAVWEKPVMVLSDYPAAAYPALLNFKAKCHGYLLWSRPLRLFEWVKEHRVLAPPLKDFYNYMIAKLRTDIGSGDANLIVVQHAARDTLVRSGLAAELDEKYTEGAPCRYVSRNEQPREYAGTNDFDRFMRRF
jgi:hypothetical protein